MSNFVNSFQTIKVFDTQDTTQVVNIPIANIQPDANQPRKYFDDEHINELAMSIKAKGIQNPIHVRNSGADINQWIIITGERRFMASKKLELTTIPAICHPANITEQDIRVLQMIENVQRENLSAMEFVRGIQGLSILGMKQSDIVTMLGVNKSTVSKIFSILELPEDWLKTFESICNQGKNIPLSKLYEIAKEENTNKKMAMYSTTLAEYETPIPPPTESEPRPNNLVCKERLLKSERFRADTIWECLKRLARKDKEQILLYIPTNKLERLLKEYGHTSNGGHTANGGD